MGKTPNIIRLLQGTKQMVRIMWDNNNWIQGIMEIVPVNFNSEHEGMLGHCKMILENDGRE